VTSNNMNNCNYLGSMGTTTNPWSQTATGIFANQTAYSIQTISDGTSNTIAFGEALVGDQIAWTKWRDGIAAGTGYTTNAESYDANLYPAAVNTDLQNCTNMFNNKQNPSGQDKGWRWATGSPGLTIFNTIVPPSSTVHQWSACRLDCAGCGVDFGAYQNANSNHPGGCNVAMCDGSVRFVKSTIAQSTWWALGTRENGEVVSADSY
jgi:prepilin-type processing-associated H-X9-DG protein